MDVVAEFANFIESCGGILKGIPNMDGASHRIASISDDKGKQSMLYRGHLDGIPNGWVQDFKSGERHVWKFKDGGKGLTPEEMEKLSAQITENAKRKAKEEEERVIHGQRVSYAVKNSCTKAISHKYLSDKHVKPFGILQATNETHNIYPKIDSGDLVLPLYNPKHKPTLVSFQIIKSNGEKKFLDNSIIKGSFGVIGKVVKDSVAIICEGFATGSALHKVTGRPVIVALNASNLPHVVDHFEGYDLVVAADNDRHLPLKPPVEGRPRLENVGVKYASSLGIPMICPKDDGVDGLDWNDFYVKYGEDKMKRAIEEQNMNIIPNKENTRIMLKEGWDDDNAESIERALIAAGSPLYVCGHNLVMPICQKTSNKSTENTGMYFVNPNTVNMEVSRNITLLRMKKVPRKDEWIECEVGLPTDLRNLIIERAASMRSLFPRIRFVTSSPTLKPSGRVLHENGYDEETQIYHFKDPSITLKSLPKTKEQAKKSLEKLKWLLSEFPFETPVDRSVAISAILACTCRGALHNIPMYAFNASTAGTGKSYLTNTISLLSFGHVPAVVTYATNVEEMEKRLGGFLMSGRAAISLDNCNGMLGGDLLCQILTSEDLDVRRLGSSDLINVSTSSIFFATGNGLQLEGDLSRRSMLSVLNTDIERPELRDFNKDPVAEIRRNRGEFLTAAFNVILSYMVATDKPHVRTLASFEEWSNIICGALVWLGEPNPMDSITRVREEDPEASDLRVVLDVLKRVRDDFMGGFGTGEIISHLNKEYTSSFGGGFGMSGGDDGSPQNQEDADKRREDRILLASIVGENGRINVRRLGRYLMRNKDRVLDGHKLVKCGTLSGGRPKWTVEEVRK